MSTLKHRFQPEALKTVILGLYEETISAPSALAAGKQAEIFARAMSSLRHRMPGDGRGGYPSDWFDRARTLGFSGSEEEIVTAVTAWSRQTSGMHAGNSFPGLFIDVQGTLLAEDNTLNQDVVTLAEQAVARGEAVTVWTDGDLALLAPLLRGLGVTYDIVSKFDFHGAEVAAAVDDLSYEEFQKRYGISVVHFSQI